MKKQVEKRTENVHVRLSKKEKRKLEKDATKLGVSISEYLRRSALGKQIKIMSTGKECELVVLCQDLVAYVVEQYESEDDEELCERLEKIWKLL